MSFDPNGFNVTVRRVILDEHAVFEARVLELPDVRGFGESATDAYEKAIEAIDALHDAAEADHEDFPAPIEPEMEFSGRVTLRMPKSLHRTVALRAQEEEISINSYIVNSLAISLSEMAQVVTGPPATVIGHGVANFAQMFMPGLENFSQDVAGYYGGGNFNRYAGGSFCAGQIGAIVKIFDVKASDEAPSSVPLLPGPATRRQSRARRTA
jgi:predicted HicB family RNase H-like nuclease